MFGSLKKKLQEAVKKVTVSISKDEVKEKQQEKPIEEKVFEEIEKKKEDLKEIQEKISEEKIQPDVIEGTIEGEKIFEEVKEEEEEGKKEIFVGDPNWIKFDEEKKDKKSGMKTVEEIMDDISAGKITREDEIKEEKDDLKKELGIDILGAETKVDEEKKETLEEIVEGKKEKKGLFRGLIKKVSEKKISEGDIQTILKELQIALLENDTSIEVAEKICDDIKKELTGKSVKRGQVEDVIKDSLRSAMFDVLKQEKINLDDLIQQKQGPFTIIVLGFNGTGKTTTVAKLASRYKALKPVVAAGDTFRAASIEQLEEHGRKIGVEVIKHKYGADSAAVIFDAKKHADAVGSKLIIADTAGRSHANVNLMDELKKVCKVNSPDMKILVLDALTGNDIYEQSRLFNDAVGVDAIILTKVDVYDKGGAALSAAYTIKKPIIYLGTGQAYEELREFLPEIIVDSLVPK